MVEDLHEDAAQAAGPDRGARERDGDNARRSEAEPAPEGVDPAEDPSWTDRMLNSLVATGRRQRGLVRAAQSETRDYVAYDAVAKPAVRSERGDLDRAAVEVSLDEGPEPMMAADRAAPTVLVRRRRASLSVVWFGAGALIALAVLVSVARRPRSAPAAPSAPVTAVAEPSRSATEAPHASAATMQPSAPRARAEESTAVPSVETIRPPRSERTHERLPAPTPKASSPDGLHSAKPRPEFVDVVTRY